MVDQSNNLARALVGLVVSATGAALLVMGGQFSDVSAFGLSLPPEAPGLVLLVLGLIVILKSIRDHRARRTSDEDELP